MSYKREMNLKYKFLCSKKSWHIIKGTVWPKKLLFICLHSLMFCYYAPNFFSEDFEKDYSSAVAALSAPSQSASLDPPESGIRRL